MENSEEIWSYIISENEPLVRTSFKGWYYVFRDERVLNEINPLSFQDFSDELLNQIIRYMSGYIKDIRSQTERDDEQVMELELDTLSYYFEKNNPDDGIIQFFK